MPPKILRNLTSAAYWLAAFVMGFIGIAANLLLLDTPDGSIPAGFPLLLAGTIVLILSLAAGGWLTGQARTWPRFALYAVVPAIIAALCWVSIA